MAGKSKHLFDVTKSYENQLREARQARGEKEKKSFGIGTRIGWGASVLVAFGLAGYWYLSRSGNLEQAKNLFRKGA